MSIQLTEPRSQARTIKRGLGEDWKYLHNFSFHSVKQAFIKKFPQNRKSWMLVAKNDNKSNSYIYSVPTMSQGFVLGLSCALPLGLSLQIHYDPLKKLLSPLFLENKTSHKIWLNQVHIQSKHCSWDRMPGRLGSRSETLKHRST